MNRPKRYIYPPIWLILGFAAIYGLDRFLPLVRFGGTLSTVLGPGLMVLALALLVYAAGLFRRAETNFIPFREATTLVTGGVYRLSRNPMYLAMALMLLGGALHFGALSALLVPPAFMITIEFRFIRPEEAMLRDTFGTDYDTYCRRVRRWL